MAKEIRLRDIKRDGRYTMDDLVDIMLYLTSEEGCPWDRRQTVRMLERYLLEESYEAIEAMEADDDRALCEELGDVLMQVAFHSALAERTGRFDRQAVVDGICRKMISRHTHIFGEDKARDETAVHLLWEENKEKEKAEADGAGNGPRTAAVVMAEVGAAMPALMRAEKLLKRGARLMPELGLERELAEGLEETLETELPLHGAATKEPGSKVARTKEPRSKEVEERELLAKEALLGDLLLRVVEVCRMSGVSAELALHKANERYIRKVVAASDDR